MVIVEESLLEKIGQSIKEQQQFFELLERKKTPLEIQFDKIQGKLNHQKEMVRKANIRFSRNPKPVVCSSGLSPNDRGRCLTRQRDHIDVKADKKIQDEKLKQIQAEFDIITQQVKEEKESQFNKTAQTADNDEILDTPTSREFNDLPIEIEQPKQDNTLRNLLLIAGLMVLV